MDIIKVTQQNNAQKNSSYVVAKKASKTKRLGRLGLRMAAGRRASRYRRGYEQS